MMASGFSRGGELKEGNETNCCRHFVLRKLAATSLQNMMFELVSLLGERLMAISQDYISDNDRAGDRILTRAHQ